MRSRRYRKGGASWKEIKSKMKTFFGIPPASPNNEPTILDNLDKSADNLKDKVVGEFQRSEKRVEELSDGLVNGVEKARMSFVNSINPQANTNPSYGGSRRRSRRNRRRSRR